MRPTRSTRPRTKLRPAHKDAVAGLVTTVDRGRYTCLVGRGHKTRTVLAMRARELHRTAIVVGDQVDLVGDLSGHAGSLARIVRIADRRSILRRSADDTDTAERILVANADILLIVTAIADPLPRLGFIDRCLVAAFTGGLQPMLLVTKSDLADAQPLRRRYEDLDFPILVSGLASDNALDAAAVTDIDHALTSHITALIGHSGVGKSTLVNALVPEADRATGTVTDVGKGRHTSSSAIAFPLPQGGWIIDTPGVRSFGLAHVTEADLLAAFDDLVPGSAGCLPGCSHISAAAGCALDDWVTAGHASPTRLASLRRLLASRSGDDPDY